MTTTATALVHRIDQLVARVSDRRIAVDDTVDPEAMRAAVDLGYLRTFHDGPELWLEVDVPDDVIDAALGTGPAPASTAVRVLELEPFRRGVRSIARERLALAARPAHPARVRDADVLAGKVELLAELAGVDEAVVIEAIDELYVSAREL